MKSSKTVVYSVRLSHKDTRAWRKAAIREQVTLAHFLRDALRKRAGEVLRTVVPQDAQHA